MRRLFWLAMGITIGVLVVRKLSTAAEAMKPQSIARKTGRGAAGLADQARLFFDDVMAGMREREDELREGVGLDVEPETPTKEI